MGNTRENGFFLIPDFENYAIDTKKFIILNLKSNKELKTISTSKVKKFKLFKNGQPHYVTLFDILHWVISKHFTPNKNPKTN